MATPDGRRLFSADAAEAAVTDLEDDADVVGRETAAFGQDRLVGRLDLRAFLVVLADLAQSRLQQPHEAEPATDAALVGGGRRHRLNSVDQPAERVRDANELLARGHELVLVDPLPGAGHDPFIGDPVGLADRLDRSARPTGSPMNGSCPAPGSGSTRTSSCPRASSS